MKFFEKATPESCGISSKNIVGFIEAMCKGMEDQETHSFMLVRYGKLVAEGYFAPYDSEVEHTLFSVSKSFASIAIGFLVEEGFVSDYQIAYELVLRCNLRFVSGEEMKTLAQKNLAELSSADPALFGGTLPADDFYYI